MANEVRGVLARTFTCLLGLGAVAWGGLTLPLFWQLAPLDHVAAAILQGQTFKTPLLLDYTRRAEAAERSTFCNSIALRDDGVFRLAILDNALATSDKTLVAAEYRPVDDATRKALACDPADSFAWLTLFWLELSKKGLTPDTAKFLRLSYALGPNEAWIALRRSRLAIALFPRLPPDLASDASDEFVKLVDTGTLYSEMAAILANATPAVQRRLGEALKSAKPLPREIFARTLSDQGLDVNIPGVDRQARPWQ